MKKTFLKVMEIHSGFKITAWHAFKYQEYFMIKGRFKNLFNIMIKLISCALIKRKN